MTDKALIDWWTARHLTTGALLCLLGFKDVHALAFAIGWEIVEYPVFLPHKKPETMRNHVSDVIATYGGYKLCQLILNHR